MSIQAIEESKKDVLETIKNTFHHQSNVLLKLAGNVENLDYAKAVDLILKNKGNVIISGMGKSGIIGKKISATLSSIGSPAITLHPADAYHGDLGKIKRDDVCILISNSGETDELLKLLYVIKEFGNKIIAITAKPDSTLARNADITLSYEIDRESCPNNLAPTASTTATLVIGDALACALVKSKAFSPLDFAQYHPGGSLGRQLLSKLKDEMETDNLPKICQNQTIMEAMYTMSNSSIGGIAIVVNGNELIGCFTDGDLRRAISNGISLDTKLFEIVKNRCVTIDADESIAEAEKILTERTIKQIVVTKFGNVVGLYHRKAT